jgi:putative oxidoreductase
VNVMFSAYDRGVAMISGKLAESLILLFVRVAFAGIFWRSARTKVEEGSWLSISDTTYFLFQEEYAGLPLPADLSVPLATYAEHFFPILLVLGLFTRFSAFALLVMTMVIQIFVYPDAWWSVHAIWAALALVLITRGGGALSLDAALLKARGK